MCVYIYIFIYLFSCMYTHVDIHNISICTHLNVMYTCEHGYVCSWFVCFFIMCLSARVCFSLPIHHLHVIPYFLVCSFVQVFTCSFAFLCSLCAQITCVYIYNPETPRHETERKLFRQCATLGCTGTLEFQRQQTLCGCHNPER